MAEKEGSSVGWDKATRGLIGPLLLWVAQTPDEVLKMCYLAATQWSMPFTTLQHLFRLLQLHASHFRVGKNLFLGLTWK